MIRAAVAALLVVPLHAAIAAPEAVNASAVVAVAPPPGPYPDLRELVAQLRTEIAAQTHGVLTANETRTRMVAQRAGRSLGEIDRIYEGDVKHIEEGEYDQAIRSLDGLVQELETSDAEGAFPRWSVAMMRLARAQELRRKGGGRPVLDRLLRVEPNATVDPDIFPPSLVARVEQVRGELAAQPHRSVRVVTGSRIARIYLQGREVGMDAVTLSLLPGRYRVSAGVSALRTPARTVEVSTEDLTVRIDAGLAERLRPDGGPGVALDPEQLRANLQGISEWLRVERLYTARLDGGTQERYLVVHVYDAKSGRLVRGARLRLAGTVPPPSGIAAFAAFVVKNESSPLVNLGIISTMEVDGRSAAQEPTEIVVRTKHGPTFRGTLVSRSNSLIVIRSAAGSVRQFPLSEVESIEEAPKSGN